jgi:hypothetical protein
MFATHTDRFAQYASDADLNLTRQDLTDKDIPDLIQFLTLNPTIRKVDLSLNNIGNLGLGIFAEKNKTVMHIDMTGNNITDEGLADFASKNQCVTEVNFSHNMISEEGIETFANLNRTCYSSKFSKMRYH